MGASTAARTEVMSIDLHLQILPHHHGNSPHPYAPPSCEFSAPLDMLLHLDLDHWLSSHVPLGEVDAQEPGF